MMSVCFFVFLFLLKEKFPQAVVVFLFVCDFRLGGLCLVLVWFFFKNVKVGLQWENEKIKVA